MDSAGFEPGTSRSVVQRPNHRASTILVSTAWNFRFVFTIHIFHTDLCEQLACVYFTLMSSAWNSRFVFTTHTSLTDLCLQVTFSNWFLLSAWVFAVTKSFQFPSRAHTSRPIQSLPQVSYTRIADYKRQFHCQVGACLILI